MMQKKIVNLVWKNELFDMNAAFAKPGDQVHCLRKVNVAIVIAVNKEDRRFPVVNGRNG